MELNTGEKKSNNYRYERKFYISGLLPQEVEALIKLHPAIFSEIYYRRYVNNIYFDSIGWHNYFDNMDGAADRKKIRIRWYGRLLGHIDKPVLERKSKKGILGKKESYLLHPFEIGKDPDAAVVAETIGAPGVPGRIKWEFTSLVPTMMNRFGRKYFLSADGHFRITLDTDLSFYPLGRRNNTFLHRFTDDIHVILELKYEQDMDNHADAVTTAFPFRLTRSSKYVSGLERLYAW